jgi:hypothetical protein
VLTREAKRAPPGAYPAMLWLLSVAEER